MKRYCWQLGILALCLAFQTVAPANAAQACLTIAQSSNSKTDMVARAIVEEAYERANLCVDFKTLPLKRAEFMLLSGRIDGDLWRSESFINEYGTQVYALEPSISTFTSVVIYNSAHYINPVNRHFLENEKIAILMGSPQGNKIALDLKAYPLEVPDYETMLNMIKANRLNAVIIPYETYSTIETSAPLPDSYKLLRQENYGLHHVLAAKNRQYVPVLTKALEAVIREKSYWKRLAGLTS